MSQENTMQTTYLDEKTQSQQMLALKAAIPFMEPSIGKRAALFIKLMEMKKIMDCFETEIAVQTEELDRGSRMLEAMRPYCGDEMLRMADFMERAAEMRRMVEMFGGFRGEEEDDCSESE